MARTTIVNSRDRPIGSKERNEITSKDIYRVASLWIVNKKGDILLAKRALSKKHNPGKWAPAVNGTVEEGETYLQNILKETEEELGLKKIKITKGPKYHVTKPYNHFTQTYRYVFNGDILSLKPDPAEISELRWFSQDELIASAKRHPEKFVSSMPLLLKLLCRNK